MDFDDSEPCPQPDRPEPSPTAWTEGNYTILSSDNFEFTVPDYHLLAASDVFRGFMQLDGSAAYVVFEDEDLETAETVNLFLNLIINGTLETTDVNELAILAVFLKGFGCINAIDTLFLQLEQGHHSAVKTFIVAAVLDDTALCIETLEDYALDGGADEPGATDPAAPSDADTAEAHTDAGITFDIRTWPLSWAQTLPSNYRWALDVAWEAVGGSEALADEFEARLGQTQPA
ncbi:hypothetical protein Q8F55_002744 [Vanrija albida]|uniref:BTB domain-containing protein n=1 Tax=Vanrija albida TaxID=181172 RepID=A0ABR3QAU2_9TREE